MAIFKKKYSQINLKNFLRSSEFIENSNDDRKISDFQFESLRNIYAATNNISKNENSNVFSINSSIPQEGKSVTSILISFILSQMGNKTLLIDCDLRNPRIDKLLELENKLGFQKLLIGDFNLWEKSIQKIKDFKNLDIITTNKSNLDPVALLTSDNFQKLLEKIKSSNKYKYIILNSTPVLGISDSILISKKADYDLFIISLDYVSKISTYEAVKLLLESYDDEERKPYILINPIKESSKIDDIGYYSYHIDNQSSEIKNQFQNLFNKTLSEFFNNLKNKTNIELISFYKKLKNYFKNKFL